MGHSLLFVSATAVLFFSNTHGSLVCASLVVGGHLLVCLCTDCTGTPLVRAGPVCNSLLHSMASLEGAMWLLLHGRMVDCAHSLPHSLPLLQA